MSEQPAFDPLRALEALTDHGVRFVVIGGFAGQLLGSSLVTNDLDVCYSRDDRNLERLTTALRELGARLRGAPEDVPFVLDTKTLKMGNHFTFTTSAGALDVVGAPAGVGGYEDLAQAAQEVSVGVFTVRVASIDDLIQMKRAAGRPRDLAAVEVLGALRDEIDAQAAEERRARRKASGGGSSRRTAGSG